MLTYEEFIDDFCLYIAEEIIKEEKEMKTND